MTQNNIAEQVNTFLANDFVVRKCLSKNIVSLRALSREIIKQRYDKVISDCRYDVYDKKENSFLINNKISFVIESLTGLNS